MSAAPGTGMFDKKMLFQLTFGFEKNRSTNFPSSFPWYSRIDYRFIVGGMPGSDMLMDLVSTENIGGVVCLVTAEELEWGASLDEKAYPEFDIAYLSKPVQSAAEMTVELINDCLEFVKKIYKQERAVYVFSSDGRSRASVIGICHFIRAFKMNTFEALDELRFVRPHVRIGDVEYRCCVQFARAESVKASSDDQALCERSI